MRCNHRHFLRENKTKQLIWMIFLNTWIIVFPQQKNCNTPKGSKGYTQKQSQRIRWVGVKAEAVKAQTISRGRNAARKTTMMPNSSPKCSKNDKMQFFSLVFYFKLTRVFIKPKRKDIFYKNCQQKFALWDIMAISWGVSGKLLRQSKCF